MTGTARILLDIRARVGESPLWDPARERLFFVDIERAEIHAVAADGTQHRHWTLPDRPTALGLAETGLVVACAKGIHLWSPETGAFDLLCRVEEGIDTNRLNDGKVGPDGCFWVGSMHERPERLPTAALWRISPEGRAEKKLDGIKVSNGLAWTPDGRTMFHSDTRGPWIDRFDFDPLTGAMTNRTRISTLDDATGRPDGATCDRDGFYWSAGVTAGRLNRFRADGQLVGSVDLPVAAPTMACFGGEDFASLFVTSLTDGVSAERIAEKPATGAVVAIETGARGVAPYVFAA